MNYDLSDALRQEQNERADKPMSLWDDTSTETIRVRKDDLNNELMSQLLGLIYGIIRRYSFHRKGYVMSCH